MKRNTLKSVEKECDLVADLFIGIQFRNGGKEEAIRRVRSLINDSNNAAFHRGTENLASALRRKDVELSEANTKIVRLEESIHEMQRNHGHEIINAITRPVYVANTIETQAAGKAARA